MGINFELKEQDLISELDENPWNKTFILNKIENLFQKFEVPKEELKEENHQNKTDAGNNQL